MKCENYLESTENELNHDRLELFLISIGTVVEGKNLLNKTREILKNYGIKSKELNDTLVYINHNKYIDIYENYEIKVYIVTVVNL